MSARPYISCRKLIELIADSLEGALTGVQAEDFQRHLALCISCRSYLATYQTTMRVGKEAMRFDDAGGKDAPEELIRVILDIRRNG